MGKTAGHSGRSILVHPLNWFRFVIGPSVYDTVQQQVVTFTALSVGKVSSRLLTSAALVKVFICYLMRCKN
jgi:hypothetical protein